MRSLIIITVWLLVSVISIHGGDNRRLLLAARGSGAATNPPVSGYSIWLHADDLSTTWTNIGSASNAPATADGSLVGYWSDTATTNDFIANTGGERRGVRSNTWFNSKPAIIFNGDSQFQNIWPTATAGAVTGITVMVAASLISSAFAFDMLVSWDTTGVLELREDKQTLKMQLSASGGLTTSGDSAALTEGKGYCIGCRYANNGSGGVILNNTHTTNIMTVNLVPIEGIMGLGKRGIDGGQSTLTWNGSIAEVIVYPYFLSDLQISNVNFYLTNKYAFTP